MWCKIWTKHVCKTAKMLCNVVASSCGKDVLYTEAEINLRRYTSAIKL